MTKLRHPFHFGLLWLLLVVLTGCSWWSPLPITTSKLDSEMLPQDFRLQSNATGPDCPLYQGPLTSGASAHVASFEACSPKLSNSLAVTTRQLLVGFDNLRILKTTPLTQNTTSLITTAIAKLNQTQLLLAIVSSRRGNCVTDVAAWTSASAEADKNEQLLEELKSLVIQLGGGKPTTNKQVKLKAELGHDGK